MTVKPIEDYRTEIPEFTTTFILEPLKTAFIPVDLQYASACRTTGLGKYLKNLGKEDLGKYRFDRIEQVVIPNVQRLLAFFRKHKLRIIYLTVGSEMPDYSDLLPHIKPFCKAVNNRVGEREHEILDEVKPLPGESVINKTTNGAFNSSSIDSVLRTMGIEYCLFAGVSTHMCVEGTARDASDRGYKCIFIDDALAANKKEYHNAALITFQRGYGRVCTTEEVIKELENNL
jgi:nicotinamidase-related amidase